jgi:pyruvate,water dikinase
MLERPGLPGRFDAPAGTPLANAVVELRRTGAERPDGGPAVLTGLASSSGRIRARAKVVLDPAVDPQTCEGRILIARETDPGWMFLMLAAKGLVVERGTILSHTAITGRVLGVPTVVAVEDATSLIPDGAWIEVDGRAGTVRLLGADEVSGGELPHAEADTEADIGTDTEARTGAKTDGTIEESTAC